MYFIIGLLHSCNNYNHFSVHRLSNNLYANLKLINKTKHKIIHNKKYASKKFSIISKLIMQLSILLWEIRLDLTTIEFMILILNSFLTKKDKNTTILQLDKFKLIFRFLMTGVCNTRTVEISNANLQLLDNLNKKEISLGEQHESAASYETRGDRQELVRKRQASFGVRQSDVEVKDRKVVLNFGKLMKRDIWAGTSIKKTSSMVKNKCAIFYKIITMYIDAIIDAITFFKKYCTCHYHCYFISFISHKESPNSLQIKEPLG